MLLCPPPVGIPLIDGMWSLQREDGTSREGFEELGLGALKVRKGDSDLGASDQHVK